MENAGIGILKNPGIPQEPGLKLVGVTLADSFKIAQIHDSFKNLAFHFTPELKWVKIAVFVQYCCLTALWYVVEMWKLTDPKIYYIKFDLDLSQFSTTAELQNLLTLSFDSFTETSPNSGMNGQNELIFWLHT